MKVIKANLNHLKAFNVYAAKCCDDGLELYADAQADVDAYFKKWLA
ncbi:hypothetical protein MSP8887_03311 [Marinomonas spartinae]|nr:hypothetical protein [Marinomonas spartinae]SBS38450.1 hypothetical protein MSP8887_03311 [Marinomonas spartinae]